MIYIKQNSPDNNGNDLTHSITSKGKEKGNEGKNNYKISKAKRSVGSIVSEENKPSDKENRKQSRIQGERNLRRRRKEKKGSKNEGMVSTTSLSEIHGRTSFFIEPGLGDIHQTISGHSGIQQMFSAFRSDVSIVSYRKNREKRENHTKYK
jgi:hypothetical protein